VNYKRATTLLQAATGLAVIIVTILFLSRLVGSFFVKPTDQLNLASGLQNSQIIPPLPNLDYNTAQRTLLIAMTARCDSCNESIPFYKRLMTARDKGAEMRIVAVFPDKKDEVDTFIRRNELIMDTIDEADLKSINVSATPTIILVDTNGRISNFWIGKLSESDEQEVLNTLSF
jgi:hypothetical protein